MKKLIFLSMLVLLVSCKKEKFSPEGPTDIRIRNLSDLNFSELIIKTSEYEEDADTIPLLAAHTTSEYMRFKKAYPKARISAIINSGGTPVVFSTAPVAFTYMQYLGTQRVTFEVYISHMNSHTLEISNVIPEEELVLK